ncbi:hypothetical protein ACA910_010205 [Epithemia clementina (nom. ined.)]
MHVIIAKQMCLPLKVASAIGQCLREWLHVLPSLGDKRAHNSESATNCEHTHATGRLKKKRRITDQNNDGISQSWLWDRMLGYVPPPEAEGTAVESAVKHDKATVPEHLWDNRVAFLLGATGLEGKQK